jgi:hypothetical protein
LNNAGYSYSWHSSTLKGEQTANLARFNRNAVQSSGQLDALDFCTQITKKYVKMLASRPQSKRHSFGTTCSCLYSRGRMKGRFELLPVSPIADWSPENVQRPGRGNAGTVNDLSRPSHPSRKPGKNYSAFLLPRISIINRTLTTCNHMGPFAYILECTTSAQTNRLGAYLRD